MKASLLLLLFVTCTFLYGQDQEINKAIDTYVNENKFSGTILITKEDSILHSNAYGLASREFNVPNTIGTKFKIASITKLFTSVLIYQLVEENRIELEKFIVDYLPEYMGVGRDNVTIHQLLSSTSGIQSLEKNGDSVYEKRLTTEEIINQYASGPLEFDPGTRFSYNNADYIILGKILEKIHNSTFSEILEIQMLKPLNMKSTGVFNYTVVDSLALNYWFNDETNTSEKDIPYFIENYYSSGAMFSTATDLVIFSEALFSDKIIKKQTLNLLLSTKEGVKDYDGYASGLWMFSFGSDTIASRPGNIWGAEAMLQRFIEKEISIIILSNGMETTNMWELLRTVQPYFD